MGEFDGKVALVTGAASGIGAASARRLADEGARVVVADITDDAGRRVADEVSGVFVNLDVGDPGAWAAAVADVTSELGGVDLVHLNAGVHPGVGDITTLSDEQYRQALDVNVDGVFFGMRAVLPQMKVRGEGAIVVTASLAGLIAYPIDPVYDLTKHAVVGLTRSVAITVPSSIVVACVCPGIVQTPMLGDEGLQLLTDAGFPVIQPEAVAEAVVRAATGPSGSAWIVQPGVCEPFTFASVPGPRTEGDRGKVPRLVADARSDD